MRGRGSSISVRSQAAPLLCAAVTVLLDADAAESASGRCARAVEQGQWREAREACRKSGVVEGHPADAIRLARAELQLGNDAEARRLATAGLEGPFRAEALSVLGVQLDRAGERDAARRALREAIAMFDTRGDARELSRSWFALAGSYWRDRNLTATLEALDAAQAAAERAQDRRLLGLSDLMRGDVMRSIGDARRAELQYELAASELEGLPADLAYVDLKQGILRQEAGMLHLADISFGRALERARAVGSQEAITAARQNLAYNAHLSGDVEGGFAQLADWQGPFDFSHYSVRAMLEADAGRLEDALKSIDQALALSRSSDAWWGEYERARILERLGDDVRAQEGYEKSIGIVERTRAAMDQSELQAWMIPRRRLPYEALLALFVRQNKTAQALKVLEAFSARSFVDALVTNGTLTASADDPRMVVSAWQRLETAGDYADDLAAALAHREVIVPTEILGRLYVAYKPAEGELRFIDRGDAGPIRELATKLTADPDLADAAAELGRVLIPDEVKPGPGTLHIVASGWLAAIPYAALRRDGRFLIEQRPLAAMPSLRGLSMPVEPLVGGHRLVLADIDGTLPSAREEAMNIAGALGAETILGAEATSVRVETAGPLELLHFGTHAGLEGGSAWLSMADGRWSTDEIIDSGVSAQVVVLAACSSAATHHDEVWGSLAIAFLANGSGSVIASLGSIGDEDTQNVMRALYQADVGRHPVQALARAQRAMVNQMPPHAWARFLVYSAGDD